MTQDSTSTRAPANSAVLGLEADAIGAQIVAEELKLLQTVNAALDSALRTAPVQTQDDSLLVELREAISTAKPDDLPALFEQMHTLGALRAQRGKGAIGLIDRKAPYFGHLRLEEVVPGQAQKRRRDVLIGSRSYVDAQSGIRIVDWRNAPVSRIFYRYQEADDYEEYFGDALVEGSVLARRTVAVVAGELQRVSSPEGTFIVGADGKWQRLALSSSRLSIRRESDEPARLGTAADGRMRQDKALPAIAALLDKEQYELITRPGAGLVAIQGSAGSGKTTVGLHRVAYLAETEPQRYRGDKMLVVVPNDALIHYVGRVLPALGVDGVPITTFARFARRAIVGLFPKLPSNVAENTPAVVARMKTDGAMLKAIALAAARALASAESMLVTFAGKWPDANNVHAAWNKTSGALDIRVTQLAQWMQGKRELGAVSAEGLPEVTRAATEKLGQQLRVLSRNVVGLWDDLCTNESLLREAFGSAIDDHQLSSYLDWCVRQARIRQDGERDGELAALDLEDHALLLRAYQVLRGALPDADEKPMRLAHLFVDEVQDASPVELRVLLDLAGKDPSVTLAGDIAQRMLEDDDERGEFSWRSLLAELGFGTSEIEPLKVSYRSTAEITTFARAVLGPFAHDAEPIATRHGPPVELFQFASPGEAVAFLADALKQLTSDAAGANVAVVARFPQQAQVFYEGLERAEVQNVRRVSKQDFSWEPGVDVTDIRQTKGLEFDEVILVEVNASSYPVQPNARHAMYVGATRAAHQLWCMATDKPSELVTAGLAAIDAHNT